MDNVQMKAERKIVDMHCDTISRLLGCKRQKEQRKDKEAETLLKNSGHIDLLRLKQSGYLLQNFALFVNKGSCQDPWEEVMALLGVYEEELKKNQELIAPVLYYEDIEKNQKQGRMSALLTVEEGAVCKGELSRLHTLYEKGVRMMTLTWNYPNELGWPNQDTKKARSVREECRGFRESGLTGDEYTKKQQEVTGLLQSFLNTPDTEHGLTRTGRRFVEEMEKLGMIPDVSHLSDAGFYDVLSCTKKPFVASHSNARSICPCARNMTDEMIRALAQRGGVMGLNFCADFLTQKPVGVRNPGTVSDIVVHAKHIANVGGVEVLGLGSDFDGIDTHEELVGAQGMEKLYDALLAGGFRASEVDKIFSENVLRVYKDTLSAG